MKKLAFLLVALQLLSSVAFAFPTKQEIHTQRVQLERLRRYVIHEFATRPSMSESQESVNQVIQTVIQLDVEILKLTFIEANRDRCAAEYEADQAAKAAQK